MSMAWQTTTDDLANVFKRNGLTLPEFELENILEDLDIDAIEGAALRGSDVEEQTDAAYQEITNQLNETGKWKLTYSWV